MITAYFVVLLGAGFFVLGFFVGGKRTSATDRNELAQAWEEGYQAGQQNTDAQFGSKTTGLGSSQPNAPSAPTTDQQHPAPPDRSPSSPATPPSTPGPQPTDHHGKSGLPTPSSGVPQIGPPALRGKPPSFPTQPLQPSPAQQPLIPPTQQPLGPAPVQPQPTPVAAQHSLPPRPTQQLAQQQEQQRIVQAREQAETKERRTRRNINITLYAAVLLLIAAAALFIGTALPIGMRFAGIVTIMAVFYAAGMIIGWFSQNLRPAAIAFTGTALGILPFTGWAIHVLTNAPNAGLSWFITTLLGAAMSLGATAVFRTPMTLYLGLPLLVISNIALGPAVGVGILWGLVFAVAVSALIQAIGWMVSPSNAKFRPANGPTENRTPNQDNEDTPVGERFRFWATVSEAVSRTNPWVIPALALTGLVVIPFYHSEHLPYAALFGVIALYSIGETIFGLPTRRGRYLISSIANLWLSMWFVQALAVNTTTSIAIIDASFIAVVSLGLYFARRALLSTVPTASHANWRIGLWVGQIALWIYGLIAVLRFEIGSIFTNHYQSYNPVWAVLSLIALVILADQLRRPGETWLKVLQALWLPAILTPGWLYYYSDDVLYFGITITLIAVLATQYFWGYRAPERSNPHRYIIGHLLTATAVFGIGQIVERLGFNDHQISSVVGAVIGLWAVLTLWNNSPHVAKPLVPISMFIALGLTATSLMMLIGSPLIQPGQTRIWVSIALATVAVMLAVSGIGWISRRGADLYNVVLGAGIYLLGLSTIPHWQTYDHKYFTVVALALLAGWAYFMVLSPKTKLHPGLTISTAVIAQLTLMSALVTLIDQLGGSGSLQRLVPSALLTLGVYTVAWRLGHRAKPALLTLHRILVIVVIAGLIIAETVYGPDRIALFTALAFTLLVAIKLGTQAGSGWIFTFALVSMVAVFSPVITTDVGWLKEPLYSYASASAILGIITCAVVVYHLRNTDSDRWKQPHWQAQQVAGVLVLAVVGMVLANNATHTWFSPAMNWVYGLILAAWAYGLRLRLAQPWILLGPAIATIIMAIQQYRVLGEFVALDSFALPTSVLLVTMTAIWWVILAAIENPAARQLRFNTARILSQTALGALLLIGALNFLALATGGYHISGLPRTRLFCTGIITVIALVTGWFMTAKHQTWKNSGRYPNSVIYAVETVSVLGSSALILHMILVAIDTTDTSQLIYWGMVGFALIAAIYSVVLVSQQRDTYAFVLQILAATTFTLSSFRLLVDATVVMQVVGLLGFVAILVAGLLVGRRLFALWGAIGLTVSVLWYLRDLTWVWVGLAGVLLLSLAIWQLRRLTNRPQQQATVPAQQQAQPRPNSQPSGPGSAPGSYPPPPPNFPPRNS